MEEAAVPRILPVLLLITAALAGCIGPTSPGSTPEGDDARDGDAPGNDLLLGSARPAVSNTVSDGAEPEMLVDQDGEFMIIADTSGIYVSEDDGETWTSASTPFTPGLFIDGPGLAQDDTGTVYAVNTNGQAVQVASSEDGHDWSLGQPIVDVAPIADRPWIGAHGDGQLGVIFYDAGRTLQEYCLASNDGGTTFAERTLTPAGPPPNAGNAVMTDDGTLYWAVDDTVYRRQPIDTPAGPPLLCNSPAGSRTVLDSVGPQVFTRVDTDGERVYTAAPTSESDKLQIAALDGFDDVVDLTFEPTDGEDRLVTNTFLDVSGTADEVAIAWYGSETEGDPGSTSFDGAWNVFTVRISDPMTRDGATLTCESPGVTCDRLTDEPNHVGEICMAGVTCSGDRDLLDYFGADHAPDGSLNVAYGDDWDGSAEEGEEVSPTVQFARLAALP